MTTRAVIADGFLVFPVTIKAGVVTVRHRLEKLAGLIVRIRCRWRLIAHQFIVALMTDGAVVVIRLLIVDWRRKGSVHELDSAL